MTCASVRLARLAHAISVSATTPARGEHARALLAKLRVAKGRHIGRPPAEHRRRFGNHRIDRCLQLGGELIDRGARPQPGKGLDEGGRVVEHTFVNVERYRSRFAPNQKESRAA